MVSCATHGLVVRMRVLVWLCLLSLAVGQPSSLYLWFSPNASASVTTATNATLSPLVSWNDTSDHYTLTIGNSTNNNPAPSFDSGNSDIVFSASAPLTTGNSIFTLIPGSILLTVQVLQQCLFPTCSIFTTAGKNTTGSLIVSAVSNGASGNTYVAAVTILTVRTSITFTSVIPLQYGQWQLLAVTLTGGTNSSVLTIRTQGGLETFPITVALGDAIISPTSSITLGDSQLRANVKDVVFGASVLSPSDLDSLFTYFAQVQSIQFPPPRMSAPSVSFINNTFVLLTWTAPFSPFSAITAYQLHVQSNNPSVVTYAPLFNNFTQYEYAILHDNITSYAFAVTASNVFSNAVNAATYPLLYSSPISSPNTTIANSGQVVYLPPSTPSAPEILYLSSDGGLNLYWSLGTITTLTPVQSSAIFYSVDAGGNFTYYVLPQIGSPTALTRAATLYNLPGNTNIVFKVSSSNIAGASNSSNAASFYYVGASSCTGVLTQGSTANSATSSSVSNDNTSSTSTFTSSQNRVDSSSTVTTLPPPPPSNQTALSSSSSTTSSHAPNSTSSSSGISSTIQTALSGGNSSMSSSRSNYSHSSATSSNNHPYPSTAVGPMTSFAAPPGSTPPQWTSAHMSVGSSTAASVADASGDAVIVGVLIGSFCGVVVLTLFIYCCFCRKNQYLGSTGALPASSSSSSSPSTGSTPPPVINPALSLHNDRHPALSPPIHSSSRSIALGDDPYNVHRRSAHISSSPIHASTAMYSSHHQRHHSGSTRPAHRDLDFDDINLEMASIQQEWKESGDAQQMRLSRTVR